MALYQEMRGDSGYRGSWRRGDGKERSFSGMKKEGSEEVCVERSLFPPRQPPKSHRFGQYSHLFIACFKVKMSLSMWENVDFVCTGTPFYTSISCSHYKNVENREGSKAPRP